MNDRDRSGIGTRLLQPLRSRKLRVALATVIAAYAAQIGLGVREELVLTILGVGASLILGIAHEDAGRGGRSEHRDRHHPIQGDSPGIGA